MIATDVENTFLELLSRTIPDELSISRAKNGTLKVSLQASGDEIGELSASVMSEEIIISCRISHCHFDVNEMKRQGKTDPVQAMVDEAVIRFSDIINDRIYLSRTLAPNGDEICSGMGPVEFMNDKNEAFSKILIQQYGNPIKEEYWLWSGKLDNDV